MLCPSSLHGSVLTVSENIGELPRSFRYCCCGPMTLVFQILLLRANDASYPHNSEPRYALVGSEVHVLHHIHRDERAGAADKDP